MLDSSAGASLKEYLLLKLAELQSIDNVKEYETTAAQALELKAAKRAYNKLKDIMEGILTFAQESTSQRDPRDSYDVE